MKTKEYGITSFIMFISQKKHDIIFKDGGKNYRVGFAEMQQFSFL
jgi:hypothetical protein